MRFSIHLIGRTREAWLQTAEAEYLKRLGPMAKLELVVHRAEPGNRPVDERRRVEAGRLLEGLGEREVLIALDESGTGMGSVALAGWLDRTLLEEGSSLRFVIGGADGLEPGLLSRAKLVLSLSPMTFTHQMARLILIEQLYRALMIRAGRPYHRS